MVAKVVIKPLEATPHRVTVKVEWCSRLLKAMHIGFAILLIPVLIVMPVARTFAAFFGNEFDSAARISLASKIAQFPLAQTKVVNTL